jgi:cytochrome c oxidase subunit 2
LKRTWWRRWLPAALLLTLGLSGCGFLAGPQSMMSPAGPVAAGQLKLIDSSLLVMIEIFIVVAAVLVIAIIRFRARPGDDELPAQVEGNNRLEVLWTIVPAILLAILAVGTVSQSFADSASPATKNAMMVDVTGHQFWFAYTYPSYGNLVTANELHIPVGTKIVLALTSADVMHSYWVPRLAGKTDLIPGKTTYMWFEASKPGIYRGQCAELCGAGHADMRILVDAQTPQQFSAWLATMQHPVSVPKSGLALQGYKLFGQVGCSSCHTINGTSYAGLVGPNLTDLTGRPMIAGNMLPNTPANLARWISDPPGVKPGALMPKLPLTKSDIKALVAYLRSLK